MLDGADGSNARLYMLEPSTLVIKKSSDNRLSPAAVTFSAYYRDGTGTERTAYSGRFLIAESIDGTNFTNKYTSSADEAAKTYTPSAASNALKCTLYAGGGTSRALDVQTVVILTDIDNLEISGRNLLQGSGTSSEIAGTGAANTVGCQYELTVPSSAIQGKQTVFACEWAYEGNTPVGTFYWQTVGTTNASVTSPVTIASGKVSGQIQQTFTPAASGSFTALRVRTDGVKGKLVIRNPRLYLGMKDIGWTPAPEDFDAAVGGVKSSIKGLETKVDNTQNSITNKIWQTDVDKSINSYDTSTVETIRNRVNSTEESIIGFNKTFSDIRTEITKKADGEVVTTLEERINTMKENADEFSRTISETYATKAGVAQIESDFKHRADEINTTLTESVNGVVTNVSKLQQTVKDISGEIEDARVGKANLRLKVDEIVSSVSTIDGKVGDLKVTADDITSELNDSKGNYARITERIDSIDQTIGDAAGNYANIGIRLDEISNTVSSVDGKYSQSLQKADGFYREVSDARNGKLTLKESLDEISSKLENKISGSSTEVIQTANDYTISVTKELQDQLNKINKSFKFTNDGLIITSSGTADAHLSLKLGSNRISFLDGNTEVAYITNNKLHITSSSIVDSLQIGNFGFISMSNGSISFNKIK